MKRFLALLLMVVVGLSLVACGGGKDSPFKDVAVGDEVVFGNYDGDITWIVLEVQEDKALLLCKSVVAAKKNNSVDGNWHTSNMLSYLNLLAGYMLTDEQKELTVMPIIDGAESKGYMFLLSSDEVETYLPGEDNELRLAAVPEVALDDGVEAHENTMGTGAYCNWILRDGAWVGGQRGNAGEIISTTKQKYEYGIRPAMWVSIS